MHRSSSNTAIEIFALGVFLAGAGAYQVWRGWATGNWRPTQGEILEAFMSEEEREPDDDDYSDKPTVDYKSRIVYKYTVHGKEYESGTLQRGLFRVSMKYFAQRQIEGFRRGQRVTVYYMPSDPSHAVLKRGAPASAFVIFAAGVVFMLLGWRFW
jgi:hypothetical protein